MSGLYWECPKCRHSYESTGRDESSRASLATFKREHNQGRCA